MTGATQVILHALSGCPASGMQTPRGCSWERVQLPEVLYKSAVSVFRKNSRFRESHHPGVELPSSPPLPPFPAAKGVFTSTQPYS
jgi:hypothetical protein